MVKKRNDLFQELIDRGLTGLAVEVGVAEGAFSFYLLDCVKKMICLQVDPWQELSLDEYQDYNNQAQSEQDRRYKLVCDTARNYGGRAIPLRATSIAAAAVLPDEAFDFVYIDANHKLEFIREDLQAWYPKCRHGGVFAGHDYLDGVIASGDYGVKTAVDEFAAQHNLHVRVTLEPDYPTWWITKP